MVKRTFMKLLEKFATSDINTDEASKVKNFLQKEIFTISNSANDAFIDYDIFNRYNFIVSDLIKRKSSSSTEKIVTVAPDRLITPSSVAISFDKLHNFKSTEMTTTTTLTTRRPPMWKPGKTPNSLTWKQVRKYNFTGSTRHVFFLLSLVRIPRARPGPPLTIRCSPVTLTTRPRPPAPGLTPLVNYLLLTPDPAQVTSIDNSLAPKIFCLIR